MEKVAIFVDVQNIYYTTKQSYQRHFNYNAFWNQATADRIVIAAYAYAIDKGDSKQQGFQQILRNIGFEVKLKPYIQRSDGTAKGDWDVGITIDVLDHASQVDSIILLSGDGDFDLLLSKARNVYGVTTEVYGVPGLTAPSLINAANRFIPINHKLLL
ncbi:MAG: NYN domain-containing protein [Methylococcaceae bacterium]|nr:NYN domain-containing protein [Methylococcaceae bacterium]MDZ4156160.1 NYN domain-containing protein [Methylococcales bacterium]MDP2393738.1 NYN domain-containing protein [Methylococcaceae bacterium]MDP3019764.1 NYN domain-containing protein [Methylococcaceae bacterium]MDP3390233.1 NYN domain-containing protein [Methylococcaceae bacterium]